MLTGLPGCRGIRQGVLKLATNSRRYPCQARGGSRGLSWFDKRADAVPLSLQRLAGACESRCGRCELSHYFSTPTPSARSVDSSTPLFPRPYPQHSGGLCASRVLSGWKRGIVRVQAQPPGLRSNPMFSLANSPVSPVDRKRLLTGGLSLASHA